MKAKMMKSKSMPMKPMMDEKQMGKMMGQGGKKMAKKSGKK
jgi:hypothetical protein